MVPIVRERGIGQEMRFSLFIVLKLNLSSERLTAILVFQSGLT